MSLNFSQILKGSYTVSLKSEAAAMNITVNSSRQSGQSSASSLPAAWRSGLRFRILPVTSDFWCAFILPKVTLGVPM